MESRGMKGSGEAEIAVYVFNLNDFLNHKLIRRVAAETNFEVDSDTLRALRARNRWDDQRQSA